MQLFKYTDKEQFFQRNFSELRTDNEQNHIDGPARRLRWHWIFVIAKYSAHGGRPVIGFNASMRSEITSLSTEEAGKVRIYYEIACSQFYGVIFSRYV